MSDRWPEFDGLQENMRRRRRRDWLDRSVSVLLMFGIGVLLFLIMRGCR